MVFGLNLLLFIYLLCKLAERPRLEIFFINCKRMQSTMKFEVSENGKLLDRVTKQTDTKPAQLIKSLEEFQQAVNESLTKLVKQCADREIIIVDDADESDEDAEDDLVSPRKRKK